MQESSFTTSFKVENSPEEVFNAINNVRGWWSENIIGKTDVPGLFFYFYKNVHRCTFNITKVEPGKKIIWHVLQNYFNFIEEETEWTGTKVIFEIDRKKDKTKLQFTHLGLVPEYECHEVCADAWSTYINHSLYELIVSGKGDPTLADKKDRALQQTSIENHPNA